MIRGIKYLSNDYFFHDFPLSLFRRFVYEMLFISHFKWSNTLNIVRNDYIETKDNIETRDMEKRKIKLAIMPFLATALHLVAFL